ncbi:MAG: hypothetical protein AB9M53_02770 [Leptothrix sp. (in: b-proteobacteria)]
MQFTATRIAAAAALALVATASVAAPNRPLTNYTTGTADVYMAGSSAVDLALVKFVANACNPNTVDVYRSDAGVRTSYLMTCETDAANGGFALPSGATKLAIHKNTNSSSDGVATVLNTATTVNYLQVSDIASTAGCTEVTVASTAGIAAYQLFTCGTTVGTAGAGTLVSSATSTAGTLLTHFGFSDSEPLQYTTTANALQLRSGYPFDLIFGIPVSKNLRDALQTQQGKTVGSEIEADMPSLTHSQINAIFTGKYLNWTDALGVTIPGNDNIYKLRRSNGSGTTRIFNATFVGEFCTPGVLGTSVATVSPVTPTTECLPTAAIGATGGTLQMATSDDMASCISTFNGAGAAAIGHLSTDYQPQAADGYRFVKVDGYAPTVLNVIDGKYKMWSELSMNYNNGRMATGITGTSPVAANNDAGAVFNRFKAASANAAFLSEVIGGLTQAGGWVGGLTGAAPNALTGNAGFGLPAGASLLTPRTAASVLAYPANPLTRVSQGRVNLCVPAVPSVAGYKAE